MLSSIQIEGFKSLRKVSLDLTNLNILIGDNGSGKSNLLQFFDMLGWMIRGKHLQVFVNRAGGGSALLFDGPHVTEVLRSHLTFEGERGTNEYQFSLTYTPENTLRFSEEQYRFGPVDMASAEWRPAEGDLEVGILDKRDQYKTAAYIAYLLQNCVAYFFQDNSANAPIRRRWNSGDINHLRSDAGNLAPLLLNLQENKPKCYASIVHTIQQVFPQFDGFKLQAEHGKVILRWCRKESPYTFGTRLTSDGTLRFMALSTLLNMPPDRVPDIVLLDEPDLGLHPRAIELLARQIHNLADSKQIIIATQSPLLIHQFDLGAILIAEMNAAGETTIKRLQRAESRGWLKKYSSGKLLPTTVPKGTAKNTPYNEDE